MSALSSIPIHPLRQTVFLPRAIAYAVAAPLLVVVTATPAAAAPALWSLLAPWLARLPAPIAWHPWLRACEHGALPALALWSGAPPMVVLALALPFLVGGLCVHGPREGLQGACVWVATLALGVPLATRTPAHGALSPEQALMAGVGFGFVFALCVAGLAHGRARSLEVMGSAHAARARAQAAAAEQLARYVPPIVREGLGEGLGESLGEGPRSERRWLSVCFADLVGFTELTDAAESEEVAGMLDDFYGEMAAAAAREGGTLDKFIGDAVMVFFGDRTRGTDADPGVGPRRMDNSACVRMALDMQQRFDCLRARWRLSGIVRSLDLRVGVHSGWCTVGVFGPPQRRAYTVVGTTVNTASRLEHAAAPGQILISRQSWLLLEPSLARRCRRLGPLSMKGLRAPVETFQVLPKRVGTPLSLEVDGLALALDPQTADPREARAVLEQALGALPKELTPSRVRTG